MRRCRPPRWSISRVPAPCSTDPAPRKRQPLEERVIEHVEQSAAEAQHRQHRHAGGNTQRPETQPECDDADVLHAVIGQQPLEIVLGKREEHAEDTRRHPDPDQHPAPPGLRRSEELEHPDEAVDPVLIITPDMTAETWLARPMGLRQPDMQGNEAGLGTEPMTARRKSGPVRPGAAAPPVQSRRNRATRPRRQQHEHRQEKRGPRCVATRYVQPASRTDGCSCSKITRKKEASAMVSQAMRNRTPFLATMTIAMLATRRLKQNQDGPSAFVSRKTAGTPPRTERPARRAAPWGQGRSPTPDPARPRTPRRGHSTADAGSRPVPPGGRAPREPASARTPAPRRRPADRRPLARPPQCQRAESAQDRRADSDEKQEHPILPAAA